MGPSPSLERLTQLDSAKSDIEAFGIIEPSLTTSVVITCVDR